MKFMYCTKCRVLINVIIFQKVTSYFLDSSRQSEKAYSPPFLSHAHEFSSCDRFVWPRDQLNFRLTRGEQGILRNMDITDLTLDPR